MNPGSNKTSKVRRQLGKVCRLLGAHFLSGFARKKCPNCKFATKIAFTNKFFLSPKTQGGSGWLFCPTLDFPLGGLEPGLKVFRVRYLPSTSTSSNPQTTNEGLPATGVYPGGWIEAKPKENKQFWRLRSKISMDN